MIPVRLHVEALLAMVDTSAEASEAGLAAFFAFTEALERDRSALTERALAGAASAQLNLGLNMLYGGPSSLSRQAAERWLGLAAEQGVYEAGETLAIMAAADQMPAEDAAGRRLFARGLGIRAVSLGGIMMPSPDPLAWLLIAAAMGEPRALEEALAPGYLAGLARGSARAKVLIAEFGPTGLETAIATVEARCRMVAAIHAKLRIPIYHAAEPPLPPVNDPPTPFEACRERAIAHDVGGEMETPIEAVRWYSRAAEAGDPAMPGYAAVCQRLATLYAEGYGVAPSRETAVAWRTRAAEAGDARAMLDLALAAIAGPLRVLSWQRAASEADTAGPDPEAARRWIERAAQADDPLGAYMLARFYQHGLAGEADHEAARQWASRAADGGLAAGTFLLAELSGKVSGALDAGA